MEIGKIVAQILLIKPSQVNTVIELLNEGSTIPFIARYRKDQTGGLDEVQIQQIQDEAKRLKDFFERRSFIEKSIAEQGKMTSKLQSKINEATDLATLEDIYLPYKPCQRLKAIFSGSLSFRFPFRFVG